MPARVGAWPPAGPRSGTRWQEEEEVTVTRLASGSPGTVEVVLRGLHLLNHCGLDNRWQYSTWSVDPLPGPVPRCNEVEKATYFLRCNRLNLAE